MKSVVEAQLIAIEEIVQIDKEVIGNDSRRKYISTAIEDERCMIVKDSGSIVAFLIYDTHFFGYSFISLIVVLPTERRKGYASFLLQHFLSIAPTKKIFSSTNQSNIAMQKVFHENGFIQSGYVENLDEGDPEILYYRTT